MTAGFFDRFEDQLRAAVARRAAPPRHAAGPTRRRRLTLLTTAISLPSAAVVLALVFVGVLGSSGTRPAPASAAQLLRQAAKVAGRQPAEPPLAPGEYHYSRELENDLVAFGDGRYDARVTVAVERWVSHDGRLRLQATPVGAPSFFTAADRRAWERAGRPRLGLRQASFLRRELSVQRRGHPFHVGPRLLSFAELRALPTTPTKLRAVLRRYAREYGTGRASAPSYEFVFATQMIRGTPASPALRAAAFRVLASLPGVRAEGTLRDHAGRSGTAVSIRWADVRRVLIFDPASARLLEERFLALPSLTPSYPRLRAGTTIGFITQQTTAVVHGPTERP